MRADDSLARFLYRPIVFREPDRVVHPPSWLEHTPFAFWVVDALRPAVLVELGTQSGNSYASFAQAVQMLGLSTACYAVDTWRGDLQSGFYDERVFADWSRYHDQHFSAFSTLIRSTFADAADHFLDGSVDLLHSDGCHTYEAAAADLAIWRPKMSRRGLILIHDINVRERGFGAWQLWEELKTQSPSFEFLHGHGLGVLAAGPDLPESLEWLFSRSPHHQDNGSPDVRLIRQFFSRLGGTVSARFASGTQGGTIPQFTNDAVLLRDRVAILSADLDASTAQAAQAIAFQTKLEDRLVRQQSKHEEALRRQTEIAAGLREQLGDESERRKHVIELTVELQEKLRTERDRLAAAAAPSRLTAALRRRLHQWRTVGRNGARRLRAMVRTPMALGLLPTGRRGISRSAFTFLAHPVRLREAYLVVMSGLFDEAYYGGHYPDVATSRLTPLAHFVLRGAYEGRNPHPLFDAAYYLRRNPDVASAAINPLAHYQVRGASERRNPHPLFDVAYYAEANADATRAGVEPLRHFLTVGAEEGRDPNPFFDCSFYTRQYPDVARSRENPLAHFAGAGWREGRLPSAAFDTVYYLSQYPDVRELNENPLAHFLERGQLEGRRAIGDQIVPRPVPLEDLFHGPHVKLKARSLAPSMPEQPTVICLSHVMPWPPRAGNEYRIYRMLLWMRDQGYRVIPVIAPLPEDHVDADAVRALAGEFSNAVLCDRDGRLEYILRDTPDVLASLQNGFARPISVLLDEDTVRDPRERQLLQMDRAFCHDALITTVLRLQGAIGPCVLLAEYIWMSRILPLVSSNVVKVVDTIDVFSTKREKVLQFGIDDLHVEAHAEIRRLQNADLILAIQDEERRELQRLVPEKRVVTAGVDFDVIQDAEMPSGRQVLYIGSDNPMNRKGLSDFLRFAWPYVRQEVPDAELVVAGRVCRSLDTDVPGVTRLGVVDDLGPLYSRARLVINPAVAGTGLKIKTLEALSRLRPIVTWPSGVDGLEPELAAFCATVQDWYDFSRRVASALATERPRVFSQAERDTLVKLMSPATAYRDMTNALDSLRHVAHP